MLGMGKCGYSVVAMSKGSGYKPEPLLQVARAFTTTECNVIFISSLEFSTYISKERTDYFAP